MLNEIFVFGAYIDDFRAVHVVLELEDELSVGRETHPHSCHRGVGHSEAGPVTRLPPPVIVGW